MSECVGMTRPKNLSFNKNFQINKTENELLKYFAYEQRTLIRLTLQQQQQISKTNDPLFFTPVLRQVILTGCPLSLRMLQHT